MRTEGIVAVEKDAFAGLDCTCKWAREQESDGWIYYRTAEDKRCPKHGKPRWPKKKEEEEK